MLAALCVMVGLLPEGVAAQEGASPQTVIQTRKENLKKMGKAMKSIVEELKAGAPDQGKIQAAAQVIAENAGQLPRWFPVGSGPESGIDTDALPYIWQNRTKFDSLASQLLPESKSLLAALAVADLAAIRAQAKTLGEVCSGCHKSFRAD